MIFLLPPSESKQPGGSGLPIQVSFPELDSVRSMLVRKTISLSNKPKQALMALKLGPNKLGELQVNLELAEPKTMPAIDRYTGVLFDALKLGDLTKQQLARAKESVFIQSSLFGLISALDEIPNYRLSAGAKLPGMNLRSIWASAHEGVWEHFRGELIVDLRSKSYSQLSPIPSWIESYEVAIVSEGSGGIRKALNHFNKQSKGNFIRAALTIAPKPIELGDLKKVAKLAGLKLEIKGKTLLLITQV